MGRSIRTFDPALAIAVGSVPASTASPWYSDIGGVGAAIVLLVKAFLDCTALAAHHFDAVLQAHVGGVAGDAITVQLVGDSAGGAGVAIAVVGNVVTIHYESGVSTVATMEAAIAALAGGNLIIEVKTAGTGATVLTAPGDNFAATHLAGGVDAVAAAGGGHVIGGFHADEALLHITPAAWDALPGLEVVCQVNTAADGSGRWSFIPVETDGVAAKYLDTTGGKVIVKNTLLAGQSIALPVKLRGAKLFRFGLIASGGGSGAAAQVDAALELVGASVQA